MNVVAPCEELRRYVPVFRVFLNKQDASAISFAISNAFQHVDKSNAEFGMGQNVVQIMVDYSDAEENGLRQSLGHEFVDKVLRGCLFHFMQSAQKVAVLVTETENQRKLFIDLCRIVTSSKEQSTVFDIFSVLCGEKLILDILYLFDEENTERVKLVKNDKWLGAKHWVDWWLRKNHLKKLSPAFTDIPEEVWESSQATNNPVESINRVSKTIHLCSLKEALQHVYSEDRRIAFLLHSTRSGRSISYSHTQRKPAKRKSKTDMGDALNPPDSKKKLYKNKIPRGIKAIGHFVEILYQEGDAEKWYKGKIIMYNKSKGYCVHFDGFGHEEDKWEKKMASDDVNFLS